MRVSVELKGLDDFAKIAARGTTAQKVLTRSVYSEAQTVLNESKKIVPVRKGILKNSGKVSKPKVDASGVEATITYGGSSAPYALYVHEDPDAQHKPGKTYKFLEKPMMAHADKFVRNVKVNFIAWLKKGI